MMGNDAMEGMENCPFSGMMGGMGGWMFLGPIFWLLLIAGVVLLVLWIARKIGLTGQNVPVETALDILKKRYALGEVSQEEFEEKKKDILALQ